jgi:hypothetical protein
MQVWNRPQNYGTDPKTAANCIPKTPQNCNSIISQFAATAEVQHKNINFFIEFNDGEQGVSYWYDEATQATYTISVQTGANKDLLTKITTTLIPLNCTKKEYSLVSDITY